MKTGRDLYEALTSEFTKYRNSLPIGCERHTICAWATDGGTVHVAREWPEWRNGFSGLMGNTSCRETSPIDNVVSRLFADMTD